MIPPANPYSNYSVHKQEIDEAIRQVLDSGWYIMGREVASFQSEFASYVGVKHGVGVGSGTDALHLALRACQIGHGDSVVTVANTAVATVSAIDLVGAHPILVEIDARTYTLDPSRLEDTIKSYKGPPIKAVIPVHLYGHPADMPAIVDIANRFGLYIVEDCAQAHGAMLHGKAVGSWGHFGAFSFYPTKNLGALGDGGALVTNDDDLAERARLIGQYGWRERYISELPGINTRLDEMQASILRVKLRYLDHENARRRRIAERFRREISMEEILHPEETLGAFHVYHQYVIRTAQRDVLKKYLLKEGVCTAILYPIPIHMQPGYSGRVGLGGDLGITEQFSTEILSLPVYPQLSDDEVDAVIEKMRGFKKYRD